ncbi:MAG TPA: hypothetical protein VHB98_20135 [Chloroflexota bacterium]|nr:hypothetical protein [Chloroflexota bacterium]
MRRARSLLIALIVVLVAFWSLAPMARAMLLLRNSQHMMPSAPSIAGVQASSVSFYTNDADNPIPISAWFAQVDPAAPTVILVPGWKDDRATMLPYARFLVQAHLNALLIDLQGTGHSGGTFSLGLHEPEDVEAAESYLDTLATQRNHHYGVLGVSFGAGVALAAAGDPQTVGTPEIRAIVADSPWATEDPTVNHLDSLQVLGLSIPLIPDASWAVNQTIGGSPDRISALVGAAHLQAGQALLLIHSTHDQNATTSLADVQQLYRSARATKATVLPVWMAPLGGHASAYSAQPATYIKHIVGFFHKYLVDIKDQPASPSYPTSTPHSNYP